jgi:hypothetical protein
MNKAFTVAIAFAAALGFSGMAAAQTGGSQNQATDTTFKNGDGGVAGGNFSESDLQANRDVTDWAGFYGTLDQTVTLSDGSTFYQWTAGNVDGAAIIAAGSEAGSFSGDIGNLGKPDDVSALSGVPTTGTERVSDTYNETDDKPADFQQSIPSAPAATLDFGDVASGDSFENFLYNSTASSGSDPVYVAEANDGATAYNGETADYQLLVGTTETGDASETFEFFAKIE